MLGWVRIDEVCLFKARKFFFFFKEKNIWKAYKEDWNQVICVVH